MQHNSAKIPQSVSKPPVRSPAQWNAITAAGASAAYCSDLRIGPETVPSRCEWCSQLDY